MLFKVEILGNDFFMTFNFDSRLDALLFIQDYFSDNDFDEDTFPFVALYTSSVDVYSFQDYLEGC